jgi:hypothetical protein
LGGRFGSVSGLPKYSLFLRDWISDAFWSQARLSAVWPMKESARSEWLWATLEAADCQLFTVRSLPSEDVRTTTYYEELVQAHTTMNWGTRHSHRLLDIYTKHSPFGRFPTIGRLEIFEDLRVYEY